MSPLRGAEFYKYACRYSKKGITSSQDTVTGVDARVTGIKDCRTFVMKGSTHLKAQQYLELQATQIGTVGTKVYT